jgi:hypothetical protein
VAIRDMDQDTRPDLAIGAPAHAGGIGRLALTTNVDGNFLEHWTGLASPGGGQAFGTAIAFGTVAEVPPALPTMFDYPATLFVGAPMASTTFYNVPIPDSGLVWGFATDALGVALRTTLSQERKSYWSK